MVKVVDCRVCGDPNSVLRFAFIEFTDEGKPMTLSLSCHFKQILFVGLYYILVSRYDLQKGQGTL